MNKNCYKLIFSHKKLCLVPVAEYISCVKDQSEPKIKEEKINNKFNYKFSLISTLINNILTIEKLGKIIIPITLLGISNFSFADDIILDKNNNNTKISQTDNKVVIVDIAKPENDGISDNRFEKFNIHNGAVFKNNQEEDYSKLVGYLDKNTNLNGEAAKAILTQVTGKESTSLKGGLEILGKDADLLVVNPNGITINGVQTFNTNRFVASTSEIIDPTKGLELSTNKGTVTIEKDGLLTDGLRTVDIVAKKIEQKGAIRSSDSSKVSDINLIAGSSKYNLKDNKVTSAGIHNNEDIIIGSDLGAMYGNNINFIVTDTGAGVHHEGIILSENDIKIESNRGKVEVNQLQSKKNIDLVNIENLNIKKGVESQKINIKSNRSTAKQKSVIKADSVQITSNNTNLESNSKIRGKHIEIKNKESLNINKDASILGTQIKIESKKLINDGTITSRQNKIKTEHLKNTGNILSEAKLDIETLGNSKNNQNPGNGLYFVDNGYVNLGTIQSNGSASLTLLNNTTFNPTSHAVPQARNDLTINATHVDIPQNEELQVTSDLSINSDDLTNNGVLSSGKFLNISSLFGIYNNGFLGAKSGYKIQSQKSVIRNEGTLHSEGISELEAAYNVTNLGEIISKGKIIINTRQLINDVQLIGDVKSKATDHESSHVYSPNWSRRDSYTLETRTNEFDYSELKNAKVGKIKSEGGLEFIQKDILEGENGGIYNNGIINIQGEFHNNKTATIINKAKSKEKDLIKDFFDRSPLTLRFLPKGGLFGGYFGLAGHAHRDFPSLSNFLDTILNYDTILKSGGYQANPREYLKDLKNIQSPFLQNALVKVLGDNWENQTITNLKDNWNKAKATYIPVHFYPDSKAKILADSITGNIEHVVNGEGGETGSFDKKLNIGQHTINIPDVSFKPFINKNDVNTQSDVDLSILLNLLADTNLFIDQSLQLTKPEIKIDTNAEDQDLLKETEEEKLAKKKAKEKRLADIRAKQKEQEEKRLAKIHKELKRQAELLTKQREEEEKRQAEQQRQAELLAQQKSDEQRKAELLAKEHDEQKRQAELKALQEAETKRQAELKILQEAEEKRKAEKLLAEKRAELLKEYERKLAEEQRKAEEIAKNRIIPKENINQPRVEVDPLYHTRAKYINQNDYIGSNYFFNRIAKPTNKGSVKVVGDNYLEHKLITQTIEKKVDNHLSLKYNLNDKELIKRLMDNAYSTAKDLDLKVGESLTESQQANLKEDIIWYVKTEVNGNEVFVPQVYLAKDTLDDAKKYQGLGTSVINARKIDIQVKNLSNENQIAAKEITIEAENKIQNTGDILANKKAKLIGHKGIEQSSKRYTDDKGNTIVEKSNIISKGHLHLETDLDHNIDVNAGNIKGKTGFVKTKDLNLNDTYEVKSSNSQEDIRSKLLGIVIGTKSESKSTADSVGSNVKFDHLHLAVQNDVNQNGSTIEAKKITGIVQGKYNTKAGKHIEHTEKSQNAASLELGLIASALGFSSSVNVSDLNGATQTTSNTSDNPTASLSLGIAVTSETENSTTLTHKNSQLKAETGELHVLGNADIGGLDINKAKEKSKITNLPQENKSEVNINSSDKQITASETADIKSKKPKKTEIKTLTTEQIADLMSEKDESFYKQHKIQDELTGSKGFTLSADTISSTKEKDLFDYHKDSKKFKVGVEIETHSAIADLATSVSNQIQNAQKGLKQDETAILQQASDIINVITGDLVGGSAKRTFEISNSSHSITESKDSRSYLGGNTSLISRNGNITLNNVESDKQSNITLTAKDNIHLNAGVSEKKEKESSSTFRLYDGITGSCGVMSQGCSTGTVTGIDMTVRNATLHSKEIQNSILNGQHTTINAGKDLNLNGANINTSELHTNVEGKTNIISRQSELKRTDSTINASASVGGSINTVLEITPTLNLSGGYGYEQESSKKVKKQSGISAGHITGQITDLHLEGGYLVDQSNQKDLTITGNITHKNINDSHHQDGGNFGASIGINENGISQFNIRGGRSEQKHYEAKQQSTLSGIDTKENDINKDLNKSTIVEKNDRFAKTKFNFEVLDIAELGKKGFDNVKPDSNDEPIYETIPDSPYSKLGDINADTRRQSNIEDDYSLVQKPKTGESDISLDNEPIYETIPDSTYAKLGDNNADTRHQSKDKDTYTLAQKPKMDEGDIKSNNEPIYETIPNSTYAKLGDNNANSHRQLMQDKSLNLANRPLPEIPEIQLRSLTESDETYEEILLNNKASKNIGKNLANLTASTKNNANTNTKAKTPINNHIDVKVLDEQSHSLTQKMKEVKNSVEQFSREAGFKFTQSKNEVFNQIIKYPEIEHDTCKANCAFWIKKQVQPNLSLGQDLYKDGKKDQLNKEALKKIKKLQTEFINNGSTATQQFKFINSWLLEQGIMLKEK
ncbi:filamentous hemagglutinin N-terminal domain-containing protein [Otariodibacter sp.]|uniref:two-partner secretion domain-containing protein n=1 Tax=Otariodibacter sp. TaxID=3030919 RepID=UPI00262E6CFE|nr:filamentous hemagglutinin N-terminal domain-containing protein [Otariodibacter sp.]